VSKVFNDRMTAKIDGDFVVFLIGLRVNKPWKLHKWIPVAGAMGPMLRELSKRRELGLLAFNTWVGPTGPLVVQYWRSVEELEDFAKSPALTHKPAWRRFYKNVGLKGDVGIWHETYMVRDGGYETLYANMPQFGLATAGEHIPLTASMHAAAGRRAANAAS
jgi:hypothetical protein